MSSRAVQLDLRSLLEAVEASAPVAAAEVVGDALASAVGARSCSLLLADFSGRALVRLRRAEEGGERTQGREAAERVAMRDTPAGRALAAQELQILDEHDAVRVFAPVTSRGDAIGLLELELPAAPDEHAAAEIRTAAHALAYIVIANRRYTDLFDWGQRSVPLSLAAEIQHRLLPDAFTCESGQFTVAGWLEPAGDIGGDTFDFSLERDTLHLSMTDAMGHDLGAAVLATIAVGASRNARRHGCGLTAQAARVNHALAAHTERGQFVTGLLARIDLQGERAHVVNAGHPVPLRMRGGRVEEIPLPPDPPFGVVESTAYHAHDLALRKDDRLLLFTDGMLGRAEPPGALAETLLATAGAHAREAVQQISRAILARCGGQLRDDATALLLDWHGGAPHERDAEAGADR